MQRRPEPLQTTRMLGVGLALWFFYGVIFILAPQPTSSHLVGLLTATTNLLLYGGLIFLFIGMFLRATAWAQAWREGTDGVYERPADVVSERADFPAEDDPDY
ncbi:MAG: hypothetical protein QOJ11_2145 [Frankiales bacterium]|jgi:hypothetical protein|nr:hypothetical protein [Frankiales bacterium]